MIALDPSVADRISKVLSSLEVISGILPSISGFDHSNHNKNHWNQ
jgi:hypothetical protein